MSDPSNRVKAFFLAAIEEHTPDEWPAFLDQVCAGDALLRAEVEKLLRARSEMGSFHEAPQPAIPGTIDEQISERPGTVIGSYKLLEQIGEGGFGVVFMAEQMEPVRRKVALKLLKPGMDSKQVIARFEAERQALALMDHPNIAHVFDGGETLSGRPYFVMELVRGVPITEFCDQSHLPVRERLELFLNVCQAIQHAHQKGIIHRDLKPNNVLVTLHDDKAVVKVIDFGIAKATGQQLTDRTLFTNFAQMIGTPLYMSPEQAQLSGLDVDTRSDIYSLGVLLYELLTGTTPFDKERLRTVGYDEFRRLIREEEPPKPSTRLSTLAKAASTASADRRSDPKRLRQLLRGELDWIVMKALEKDRNRRYETASAFAADVQRYLTDEPVLACPPTAWYRFCKFARRNKARLAVATCLFLAVTVMVASIGWVVRDRAERAAQNERAEFARRAKVESQARNAWSTARTLLADNKLASARQKLAEARALLGNDRSVLGDLAAEIEAGEAALDRFQQFLDLIDRAHQEETAAIREPALAAERSRSSAATLPTASTWGRRPAAAVPILLQALHCYEILERNDWNTTLADGLLGKDQSEHIRRTAYAELLWLADDVFRRQQEHGSGRMLSAAAAAGQAIVYLAKAASAHPPTLALYALRARCRKTLGEQAGAQADQELADNTPPTMALDHYLRGQAAYDTKQLAEGVQAFEAALRQEPTHYWSMMRLGWCLCDLGQGKEDFSGAARVFTGCILKRPGHAHAYYCRGNASSKLGRYQEAVADHSRAIKLDPKFASAWNNRGRAYLKLGQPEKAVADLSQVIDLNPKHGDAWNNRGIGFLRLGQLNKAAADFSTAIDLNPRGTVPWINRGFAHHGLRKFDKALADLSQAIKLDSKDAVAWASRAAAYLSLGQPDKALADCNMAIKWDPKEAMAWNNRGLAYYRLRQLDKALADYSWAIELDPSYAVAWSNRAAVYNDLKQPDKALADCDKAIELDQKLPAAWTNRGGAHHRQGQFDKAVADFSRAIELSTENDMEALFSRALAYQRLGRHEKAVADYSKVVEKDQKDAEAWFSRGLSYYRLGRYAKAVADLSRAIKMGAAHPQMILRAYCLRADAHNRLAHFEEARKDYKAALDREPDNAGVHNQLAWLLANCQEPKLRDPDQAVKLAKKAVHLAPKAAGYWNSLGVANYRAGDWKAAIAALDKSVELRGGDAFDFCFLAMAHRKLGHRDEARTCYDQAVRWLEKNKSALEKDRPLEEDLRRFRSEAEVVLELNKK